MLDFETKNRINTARDILVGKVPDPKSQVEQITIALIYKFMDDMDLEAEELGGKRTFFVDGYSKYSWRKIFDPRLSGYELLNLYSEAIAKMDTNPGVPKLFRDIFNNAYLPYRDPETLKSFLKIINEFEYTHSEKLGDAFEYLLSILGSQGDAGMFRTPRHIIDFMVAIINPKKNETILDPACGTAGFLISSYRHIIKHNSSNFREEEDGKGATSQAVNDRIINSNGYNGDLLSAEDRKMLADNIYGYDISPDMVRLSLVNMYLHGIKEPHISEYDTLTSEDNWHHYSDVILANPPFMSPKGGIRPHKRFSVQSNRSEVLFVDYIAEHLTANGRAAIIVPEGVIFQSGNAYKQLRKMLVEEYLVGVISLPAGIFQPYSGVKTSILWLDKTLAKGTDKILFVKVNNDGYDLGAQRRAIKENDLPSIQYKINTYKEAVLSSSDDLSDPDLLIINKRIIAHNEYSLSGERYKVLPQLTGLWQLHKIEDLFKTMSGGTPLKNKSEYYTDGNIPWIKSGEVGQGIILSSEEFITEAGMKNSSAKLLPINSVLVAMYGATVGNVGLLKFQATTNQAVCAILPNEKVIPEFLYYLLKAKRDYLVSLSVGGAQPNISQGIIRNLVIPVPPISYQKEIVAELESYQKIIDGARMIVENYKPRIEIDPEWEIVELGDHIDFISGLTLSIPDCEKEGGTPIISMNSITEEGELIPEGIREIKLPNKKTINYMQKGDLLFNWRNGSTRLVGKTGLFEWDGLYVFASFLLGIRAKPDSYKPKFLWILLNQYRAEGMYESFMRQNVNGLFNREELKILKVPLPSIELQQTIIDRVNKEMTLMQSTKEIIMIYDQKIKDRIAKVWGV